MERYNYHAAMKEDILEYIQDNYTHEEISEHLEDVQEWGEKLYDTLWIEDSVTGNASGSYTFNTWQAEENLCHNLDLLKDALDEFGCDYSEALEKGAEHCDVTIRCYLLIDCILEALSKLEEEYKTI